MKLPDSYQRERSCRTFIQEWQQDYQLPTEGNINQLITQLSEMDKLGLNKNIVTLLTAHKNFEALYISDHITDILGYQKSDIKQWNAFSLFNLIYWKQLTCPVRVHQWGNQFIKKVPSPFLRENPKNFFCGLKVKTKLGKYKTCFFNITRLTFDENNQPSLSIIQAQDITPLYKGDAYWIRFVRGSKTEYSQFFTSKGKKESYKDLISKRELQILKLIGQQYSSKDIGERLNISLKTVEQHRKNMIARSGAKDATALVQLCRMAEII